MPQELTYPGVYIEEIPSGVRTIVGVATSITAFAGRAPRGRVDEAVQLGSYTAFVEEYGGLWPVARLAYAVRDFFLNGGSQAVIARVFEANSNTDDGCTKLDIGAGATVFTLVAASPGAWGNALRVLVDHRDLAVSPEARFNLTVTDTGADRAERIVGISLYTDDPRRLDRVLERESRLVALDPAKPLLAPPAVGTARQRPADGTTDAASEVAKGAEPLATAVTTATGTLPKARADLAKAEAELAAAREASADADAAKAAADEALDTLVNTTIPDLTTRKTDGEKKLAGAEKLDDKDPTKTGKVERAKVALKAATDALAAAEASKARAEEVALNAATDATAKADKVTAATTALDAPKKALADASTAVDDARKALAAELAKVDGAFGAKAGNDGKVPADFWDRAQAMLDRIDLFNLLCIPPYEQGADVDPAVFDAAAAFCTDRRAMLIVDPPSSWSSAAKAKAGFLAEPDELGARADGRNAAVFFPRLRQPDPLLGGAPAEFAPCGAVAGVFARTDGARGVWKAPAGLEASLTGVPGLSVKLADFDIGLLNPLGINCIRSIPAAGRRVVWGSRTLVGADVLASEWKYIPVRRLALFIEESLFRGTQWVVFEPNDEPLWAQIRLNVGAFMQDLFRQGAFAGMSPREAFAVRCDRETTTDLDQQRGVVNIVVQFAPLRPAEFVVIRLQQLAGQTET